MILGFGAVEERAARNIINECHDAIKNLSDCEKIIDRIKKKYDAIEKKYAKLDKAKVPERYSYFWHVVHRIYEDKYIIEFHFHHINRRHALSPDGWALLCTEWILVINNDEKLIYKQA